MSDDRNHEAFEKLFLPLQPTLRGYLFAATRDWAATEELFQEVALVLWRKFGAFNPALSFRAWALGIARLQVLKQRQALARSRVVFSEALLTALTTAASAEPAAPDRRLPYLAACLEKLPGADQNLVALRFEQDQSLAEIAARIRKSVAAVAMALLRVRRRLRHCVETSMALEREGVR